MPSIIAKEDLVFDTVDSQVNIYFKQNNNDVFSIQNGTLVLPYLNVPTLNVSGQSTLNTISATSLTIGSIVSTNIINKTYINTNTLNAKTINISDSNGNANLTSTKLSIQNIELADSSNNVLLTTSDVTAPNITTTNLTTNYVKVSGNIQLTDNDGNVATLTGNSITINKSFNKETNISTQLNVTNSNNDANALIDYATINYDLIARNIRIGNTLKVIGDTTFNNNITFNNENGSIQIIAPEGKDSTDNQVINLPRNVEKDLNLVGEKLVSVNTDYNANAKNVILADTSNKSFTITLPANPNIGDVIKVIDDKGTFDNNPLTIDGNGNTIDGDDKLNVDIKNEDVTLVFSNSEWKVL